MSPTMTTSQSLFADVLEQIKSKQMNIRERISYLRELNIIPTEDIHYFRELIISLANRNLESMELYDPSIEAVDLKKAIAYFPILGYLCEYLQEIEKELDNE